MLMIAQLILTYFVWVDGYQWFSLIPMLACAIVGLLISVGIGVAGGNPKEMFTNKDPKLVVVGFFIDLVAVFALIIMLVAN